MTSVGPSDANANPRGSYVDLVFKSYVPEARSSAVERFAPTGIRLQRQVRGGSLPRHAPAQSARRHQAAPDFGRHEPGHGDGVEGSSSEEDSREGWRNRIRRMDLRRATTGCGLCTAWWATRLRAGDHESRWPEDCARRERSRTRASHGCQRFERNPRFVRRTRPRYGVQAKRSTPIHPQQEDERPHHLPPPDPLGQDGPSSQPNPTRAEDFRFQRLVQDYQISELVGQSVLDRLHPQSSRFRSDEPIRPHRDLGSVPEHRLPQFTAQRDSHANR